MFHSFCVLKLNCFMLSVEVLDHFSQLRRHFFYSLNRRLTERHFAENSFHRKVKWPILLSAKKCHLTEKKCAQGRSSEYSFDRKLIYPKCFSENEKNLTERSFDRKLCFEKWLWGKLKRKKIHQKPRKLEKVTNWVEAFFKKIMIIFDRKVFLYYAGW
jgi:hypothetical protein